MALSDKNEKISLNSLSAIRRVEDEYTKRLLATSRQLERKLTDLLQTSRTSDIIDTALARQQIESVLLDSGYFETTGQLLNDGYQAVIDESAEVYNKMYNEEFRFQNVSLQRLDSLKKLDFEQFKSLSDQATTRLSRVLTDLQFGSISFDQATDFMRNKVVDQLQRHAETWVTTGLSGIYRESTVALAEDNGVTRFQYVGPVDSITRPFCAKHVGQVKTIDEWNKLDNGQISPVGVYGGGYNCRHSLIGVE
jgi:hypothetical protein